MRMTEISSLPSSNQFIYYDIHYSKTIKGHMRCDL